MSKFDGSQLKISLEGVDIDNLSNVGLTVNNTVIECTNFDSAGFRDILSGTTTWSMSATAFVDYAAVENFDEAMALVLKKPATVAAVELTTGVIGDTVMSGNAFLVSVEKTGELDTAVVYSITLEGTGVLAQGVEV